MRAERERGELRARIEAAEAAERERISHEAKVRLDPSEAGILEIAGLGAESEKQAALREVGAPRITAAYEPGAPEVLLDGNKLP